MFERYSEELTALGKRHPRLRWPLAALLALLYDMTAAWNGTKKFAGHIRRFHLWIRDKYLPLSMDKGRAVCNTARQWSLNGLSALRETSGAWLTRGKQLGGALGRRAACCANAMRARPLALHPHASRRAMAMLLSLCMILTLLPGSALGTETGKCNHVHDEDCGYVEAVEGSPCAHTEHDEDCGYVEAVPETPCDKACTDTDDDGVIDHASDCAYAPGEEGQPCKHEAGEHDDSCGYVEAVEGSPCTHVHDENCGGLTEQEEACNCGALPDEDGVTVHEEGCPLYTPPAGNDLTPAPLNAAEEHTHGVSTDCTGGDVTFTALTAADTTLSGGSYFLEEDVKLTGTLTITGAVDLCLNGHKLTYTGGSVVRIESGATLNLCDCNGGKGSHTVTDPTQDKGVATVTGGVITGGVGAESDRGVEGGGVYVDGGTFYLYGGAVSGNSGAHGGGVYVREGAFHLYGGSVSYNDSSTGSGGGVYAVSSSTVTVSGGEISKNAASMGGGLYVDTEGTSVSITGGQITGNLAAKGGGVYASDVRDCTLSGGEISGNVCAANSAYGGGVYLTYHAVFTMTGGRITGNAANGDYSIAYSHGGGVYVESGTTFAMSGGEISGNSVGGNYTGNDRQGGGMYVAGTLNLSGTPKIADNINNPDLRTPDNLYLPRNVYAVITEPLTKGALICVHVGGDGKITGANSADYSAYFFSDDTNCEIACDSDNSIKLVDGSSHRHGDVKYTPWTEVPTSPGNYYLTGDVTLTSTWTIPSGTVNLCLGKYKMTLGNGAYIDVGSGAALNVVADEPVYFENIFLEAEVPVKGLVNLRACITNGESQNAAVRVSSGGTLNLDSGTIWTSATDTAAAPGEAPGAVCNRGGTVNVRGGQVLGFMVNAKNNCAVYNDGGTVGITDGAVRVYYYEGSDYSVHPAAMAIYNIGGGIDMTGGLVANNGWSDAYGIYNAGAARVSVTGGVIDLNHFYNKSPRFYTCYGVYSRPDAACTIEFGGAAEFRASRTSAPNYLEDLCTIYARENDAVYLSGAPKLVGRYQVDKRHETKVYLHRAGETQNDFSPRNINGNDERLNIHCNGYSSHVDQFNVADGITETERAFIAAYKSKDDRLGTRIENGSLIAFDPHKHGNLIYNAFDAASDIENGVLKPGSYYLTADTTFDAPLTVNGTVYFCLGGHQLTVNAPITVTGSKGRLYLSNETGGKITSAIQDGYTMKIEAGGIAELERVEMENTAGGVILNAGEFGTKSLSGLTSTSATLPALCSSGSRLSIESATITSNGNVGIDHQAGTLWLYNSAKIAKIRMTKGAEINAYNLKGSGAVIIISPAGGWAEGDLVVKNVNSQDVADRFKLDDAAAGYELKYNSSDETLTYGKQVACTCAPGYANMPENFLDTAAAVSFPKTYTFGVNHTAFGGTCEMPAHQTAVGQWFFALKDGASDENAAIDNTAGTITFQAPGTYPVTCTFTVNGKSATKDATFTLTEKVIHTHGDGVTFDNELTAAGGALHAGNYFLRDDVALTNPITISGGTVNLCLNGKQLTYSGTSDLITLSDGATLNLYDAEGGGAMTHGGSGIPISNGSGCTVTLYVPVTGANANAIYNRGTLNICSGALALSENSSGIQNVGTVNVSGGTVKGMSGYGIQNGGDGSTANISGGEISGYEASIFLGAGALYLSGAPAIATPNGSDIHFMGGTIYATDGAESAYSGGEIKIKLETSEVKLGDTIVTDVTDANSGSFVLYGGDATQALQKVNGNLVFAQTYSIAYDAGEGTPVTDNTRYFAGDMVTLPTSTRDGFTLMGWSLTSGGNVIPDADGGTDGTQWALAAPETGTAVTLYAVWGKNVIPPSFTDGNTPSIGAGSLTYGSITASLSAPEITPEDGHSYSYSWYYNRTDSTATEGAAHVDGTEETMAVPTDLNAGDYWFFCVVTASKGEYAASATSAAVQVRIVEAAMPDITVSVYHGVYDGVEHACATKVAGAPTDSTVSYSTDNENFSVASPTVKNVTAGAPFWVKVENPNYEPWTSDALSASVSAATPTVTLEDRQTGDYSGGPVGYPGVPVKTGVAGGDAVTGAVSYQYQAKGEETAAPAGGYTDGLPTDAGAYWLRAKLAADGNYGASDWSAAVIFTVAQKPVAVTWTVSDGYTYTGEDQSGAVSATYTKVDGADIPLSVTFTGKDASFRDAGEYTASASMQAADGNYTLTGDTKNLSIAAREYGEGFDIAEIGPQTFTGSEVTPEPAVKFGETVLVQGKDYDLTYSANTAIGENAKVVVSFKGNFSGSKELTFAIVSAGLPSGTTNDNIFAEYEAVSGTWSGSKEGVTFATKDGWTVSTNSDGTYEKSVTLNEESKDGGGTTALLYVKDGAGHVYTTSVTYQLDRTPPEVDEQLVPDIEAGVWTKGDITVSFTAFDGVSGIRSVTFSRDHGDTAGCTPGEGNRYHFAATENGSYQVAVTDNANQTTTRTIEIANIDKDDPAITGWGNDALTAEAGNAWAKDAQTVTVTGSDGTSSVTVTYSYSKDGGEAQTQTGGALTLNTTGKYTVEVTVTDAAGNKTTETKYINVDVEDVADPVIKVGGVTVASGKKYLGTTLTLDFTATPGSPEYYSYTLGGQTETEIPLTEENQTVALNLDDGENTLRVTLADAAGHKKTVELTFLADTSVPAAPDLDMNEGGNAMLGVWSNADVTVALPELSQGIEGYAYREKNTASPNPWTPIRGLSQTFSTEENTSLDKIYELVAYKTGEGDVTVYGAPVELSVKLDKTIPAAPTVMAKVDGVDYISDTWTAGDVEFTLTRPEEAQTTVSGHAKYQVSIDEGNWIDVKGDTVTVSQNTAGAAYRFRSVNKTGAPGAASEAVLVKRQALSDEVLGREENVYVNSNLKIGDALILEGWYTGAVTVFVEKKTEITVREGEAYQARTYYKLDGAETASELTGDAIDIAADGVHTLEIWTKDDAGNETTHLIAHINVDQTPPDITYDAAGSGNPQSWTGVSADITFRAADVTSQVHTVTVTRAGQGDETEDAAYSVKDNGDGNYTFTADRNGKYTAIVTDKAGNVRKQEIIVDKIDKDAPIITATPPLTPDNWYGATEFTVVTDDQGGSGNVTVTVKQGETPVALADGKFTAANAVPGAYDYTVTAADGVGNQSSLTITIPIDQRIDAFLEKIDALGGTPSFSDMVSVKAWYDALNPIAKGRIGDNEVAAEKLADLKKALAEQAGSAAAGLADVVAGADTIDKIQQAQKDYDALPEEVKNVVSAQTKAALAEKAADAQTAKNAVYQLASSFAPGVSYEQKAGAVEAYEKLTAGQKELADREGSAAERYDALRADVTAVAGVIETITAVKKPYSGKTMEAIAVASAAYAGLSEARKDIVPAAQKSALKTLEDLRACVAAAETLITALPETYTKSGDAAIKSAKTAYDSLTRDEKAMVGGALKTKLDTLYQAMLDAKDADGQAATVFASKVAETKSAPTVEKIKALEAAYAGLSARAKELLDGDEAKADYERLIADKAAAETVMKALNGITPDTMDGEAGAVLAEYDSLSDSQKALVDEAAERKPADVQKATVVLEAIAAIPVHDDAITDGLGIVTKPATDIGPDCAKQSANPHTLEEHQSAIERAKEGFDKLPDGARDFISLERREKLEKEYTALLTLLGYQNHVEIGNTVVKVTGLTDKVALPTDSIGADKTVIDLVAKEEEPEAMPPAPEGKAVALSVDVKLVADIYTGVSEQPAATEIVQPIPGKSVIVSFRLPTGFEMETLEIWHVKESGARTRIYDFQLISEPDGSYAVFEVGSFSHFVFFAEKTHKRGSSTPSTSASASTSQTKLVKGEHGSISINPQQPKPGETVVITPKPDEGYVVDQITVMDQTGNKVPVNDNGDGTWRYTQPKGEITITAEFKPSGKLPFMDVKAEDWFYDSVRYVYENGLMNGTSKDKFQPDLDTSRGMIVTILWRREGAPADAGTASFSDVAAGAYYYQAIAWGAAHGIVKGYDNHSFGPDDSITREQLAAILYRYARSKGMDATAKGDLSGYSDQPDRWAEEPVRWAVGAGIISGKGNGVLDPKGQATRAETAAMLQRLFSIS